jgi:predicted nucleic acid-binding protein
MKVVTNAGPLIALGKLGLVHFLSRLYSPLLIPSPVYDEVVTRGIDLGQADAYAVQMAIARRELVVVPAKVSTRMSAGSETPLHAGEYAAIRLAQEEAADWVLLDDQLAREHAQALGLHVKGTLGVIVEAQRRGLLTDEEVELVFQAIMAREDIWISDMLVRRVRDAWRNSTSPSLG